MKKHIKISLIVVTEDEHDNKNELKNIETSLANTSYYLLGIFGLLKSAARHQESYTEDNKAFCEQVSYLCDIGTSLADSVWEAASDLESYRTAKELKDEIQNEKILGANRTAIRLENILTSNNTPDMLKTALFALLDAESFERGLTFNDSRIIRYSFPLLLESIGIDSARVFLSAIENLIDSFPQTKNTEVGH